MTEVISIPSSKVGLVMGRGGETIRQICMASGAQRQVRRGFHLIFFHLFSWLTTIPLVEQEKRITIKPKSKFII